MTAPRRARRQPGSSAAFSKLSNLPKHLSPRPDWATSQVRLSWSHTAGYGTDVVVVGAGAVVEVGDGLEVVVDTGGGMVGSWRRVVVVDSGAVVGGGRTAVVLVVRGTVLWTGAGAGATGTNTGRGTGAGRTSRYRTSTARKATTSAMVDRRTRMAPIMSGGWVA